MGGELAKTRATVYGLDILFDPESNNEPQIDRPAPLRPCPSRELALARPCVSPPPFSIQKDRVANSRAARL